MNIKVGDVFTYNGKAEVGGSKLYEAYVGMSLYIIYLDKTKIYFSPKQDEKFKGYCCYFLTSELNYLTFKNKCNTVLPLP